MERPLMTKVVGSFSRNQQIGSRGRLEWPYRGGDRGIRGCPWKKGFGYGVRNEEGRAILDFAIAHDLVVVNSYFKKRDHHLVTFQSGGRCTQIDLFLVRRGVPQGRVKTVRGLLRGSMLFPTTACSALGKTPPSCLIVVNAGGGGSALPRRESCGKNLIGDATEAFRSRVVEGVLLGGGT
ncbi:retrovirus-related pol polyprotein LINE-1 [Tanacetum coccineum]